MEFLNAQRARVISSSTLANVFYLIEQAAHNFQWEITINKELSDNVIKVLTDYGYKIEYREIPIYPSGPYGQTSDEPSSYKKETKISWGYENLSNS